MINKEDLTESCSHTLSPLVSKLEKNIQFKSTGNILDSFPHVFCLPG